MGAEGKRPRGRPNDAAIDEAVLEAARGEFLEKGYQGLTMESVAARARVSKVSLYRRWKGKAAVMGELFRRMGREPAGADESSLELFVRGMIGGALEGPEARDRAALVLRTIGEISLEPELLALYRERVLAPRMDSLRAAIERARARGELAEGVATDAACALVAGPLLLGQLALLAGAEPPLGPDAAGSLARAVLDGIGSRK